MVQNADCNSKFVGHPCLEAPRKPECDDPSACKLGKVAWPTSMHWGRLKSDLLSRSQMLSEALSVGYFLKFIQTAPSGARSYLHPPHNPPFSPMLQPLWQKVLFFKTLGFWAFRSKREMRPDCQNYKTSTRQVDFPPLRHTPSCTFNPQAGLRCLPWKLGGCRPHKHQPEVPALII